MKNLKLLFLIIFLGSLLFPLIGLASLSSYEGYGKTIYYEGLVPCGKSEPLAEGESEEVKLPCQFCHFFVMFKSILDFVLKLVIIIAVLMLTVGGFMFFFAGGNPAALDRAKGILTSTAIGLVIIFAAWLIVNSILTFPGFINPQLSWDPTKWFQVECPIEKIITKEREKKEDYQKKITNLEKEIAELEEERTAAARDQNIEKVKGLTYEIAQIQRILQNYETELADLEGTEEEEPEEVVMTKEEKEKHCRWEECGRGPLNPCDEKECLALGDSVNPCKFIATRRTIFTGTEYGYCEPK